MINRLQDYEHNANGSAASATKPNETNREPPQHRQRQLPIVEKLVSQHPVALVAIGLAAGLTLGWWVKRK
jgi:ElaB/YqjD/DUF883 family membrane-anchored ribosome-binding protein